MATRSRRCAFILDNGQQCKNYAQKNSSFCYMHVGQAGSSAKERTKMIAGAVPLEGESVGHMVQRYMNHPTLPHIPHDIRSARIMFSTLGAGAPRSFASSLRIMSTITMSTLAPVLSKIGIPSVGRKIEKRAVAGLVKTLNKEDTLHAELVAMKGAIIDGKKSPGTTHYAVLATVFPQSLSMPGDSASAPSRTMVRSFIIDPCPSSLSPQKRPNVSADMVYPSGDSFFSSGVIVAPVDEYFADHTVMWDKVVRKDGTHKAQTVFDGRSFYASDETFSRRVKETEKLRTQAVFPHVEYYSGAPHRVAKESYRSARLQEKVRAEHQQNTPSSPDLSRDDAARKSTGMPQDNRMSSRQRRRMTFS